MSVRTKQCVLVVDDDAGICETMADILDGMNYDVKTASDGYKALDLVNIQEFNMTLMDVRMPGLNGLETLKMMRQVRPSMKVVMITAYSNDEMLEELKRVGVEAILSKPLKFSELFKHMP